MEAPKRYRVRITSGLEQGRYVGLRFGCGMVTNPAMQQNPPVNVADYGLWAQERTATVSFEGPARTIQADLKALGYDSELVEVA
jgi:hypothetical protein